MFRTRIELKQIGVRDEAKRLDGIGRCGRQYCSSSWLPELRPVNLGVAKDQRLSLNPSQISGACGRLMCCLRYEHEFYVQQRKRFPKEGKMLRTSRGEEKVVANDIFRERVTLRGSDGEMRLVPLEEFRRELEAMGVSPLSVPAATDEPELADPRAEMDEEETELDAEEIVVDEAPAHSDPSITGSAAAAGPVQPDAKGEAEGARKPHRRRGRRGGRRNRAGRERGDAGTNTGGSDTTGA